MRVKVVYIVPQTPLHRKEESHVLARGEFPSKRRLANVCSDTFGRLVAAARSSGSISFQDQDGNEVKCVPWTLRPGRTLIEVLIAECPYSM